MTNNLFFIDVIVPIPIKQTFTYQVSQSEYNFIQAGFRVVVPFGKSKTYTAIVVNKHQNPPAYQTKEINQILDETPVLFQNQLNLLNWVSSYYLNPIGDVLKYALPSPFLLESETFLQISNLNQDINSLTGDELLLYQALQTVNSLSIKQLQKITNKKNNIKIVNSLVEKGFIKLSEVIYEKYTPKIVKYVALNQKYQSSGGVQAVFNDLKKQSDKQKQLLITFFTLKSKKIEHISASDLLSASNISASVLNTLVKKQILDFYYLQTDRISLSSQHSSQKTLTTEQQVALSQIQQNFTQKNVVLLYGKPSSGKTEVYIQLIQSVLDQKKQVLLLFPEISIATQMVNRLKEHFASVMSVYHNKYSNNEKVEVWKNMLNNSDKTQLIIGLHSSVFLPFTSLGLVIIDEEHDGTYKLTENSPRFSARDSAIVLANYFNAKTLLVTSTPSSETFYNTKIQKYGIVELNTRYNNLPMPQIELIDIKDKTKRKRMYGAFSDVLIDSISETLQTNNQAIIYQNRRGYAPFMQCPVCGTVPKCPNCDVSLTYHQAKNEMRCHYCGHTQEVFTSCPACGSANMQLKGVGTEKVEEEISNLFPKAKIARLDKDSTTGKFSYEKIIDAFEKHEIDILVGTQMVTKGLDFQGVNLAIVLNVDTLINFPNFNSNERAFQVMYQIAGRSGRHLTNSKVLIQTSNPYTPLFKSLISYDYTSMIENELLERQKFNYPPFYKIILITFKYKNYNDLNTATTWFTNSLKSVISSPQVEILGPEFPPINRIRNEYIKNILIKFPNNFSHSSLKSILSKLETAFHSIGNFRNISLIFHID